MAQKILLSRNSRIEREKYCNKLSTTCVIKEYVLKRNIAKGTTDPRVEFISQGQIQILIKFYLKNLDQASTSKSQPNISILTILETSKS